MSRKGIIALGILVGVTLVAGILRIKFYFDPPEDNFTNRMNALTKDFGETDTLVTDNNTINTLSAVPQVADTIQYILTQQYDLGSGIVLDVVGTADHMITIQLQGSELVTQTYDLTWQPVADSRHVLQSNAQLVGGMPPQAKVLAQSSGYVLLRTAAQTDHTYAVIVHHYSTDWVEQSSVTLQDNIPVMEGTSFTLSDSIVWLFIHPEQLYTYTLDGTLLSTQTVDLDQTDICDLVPDQTNIVLVLESAMTIILQKQDQYGKVLQIVSFPRLDSLVRCQAVLRKNEQLVVQLPDSLVPYADNLSEQYQAIPVTSAQFFPQVTLHDKGLWLAYSTSTTLGEYSMHVMIYAVTAKQPDATTEYTN